jgi:hypothetical protein
MRPATWLVGTCLLLAGCSSAPSSSSSPALPGAPAATRAQQGDLPVTRLRELLLQPADLPDLPSRRPFASADLSTQATPQLALCQPAVEDAPHQLANLLAQSGEPGQANVFEVLSAYADQAAAQAAYDRAAATAQQCSAYDVEGVPYRVEDLRPVAVPAGDVGVQYRLTTPSVVSGDVRTLVRSGRFLVLITGFGAPPSGQSLLDLQAEVAQRALARLS